MNSFNLAQLADPVRPAPVEGAGRRVFGLWVWVVKTSWTRLRAFGSATNSAGKYLLRGTRTDVSLLHFSLAGARVASFARTVRLCGYSGKECSSCCLRTMLRNRVRALLAQHSVKLPENASLYTKQGRAWLDQVTLPDSMRIS